MEAVWRYFKVQLPGYLRSLPLPKSLGGFSELTRDEWMTLLPFFLFLLVVLYLVFSPFLNMLSTRKQPRPRINRKQNMSENKVVSTVDIEDIKEKAVFCRCWKSSKFPYCDGCHNNHNQATGDNVGPLIIAVKKDKEKKEKK